jgi:UDP-N-acetylglucosamine 4,6-dehydratase
MTDSMMNRFMFTPERGVDLAWHAFEDMVGGEIYVKKNPSMKVTDIAHAVAPTANQDTVGIRPSKKLQAQ